MEKDWERACLGYYKERKEKAEKFKETFKTVYERFSLEEFNYITDLVEDDIKESENQIKYYTELLKEEECKR